VTGLAPIAHDGTTGTTVQSLPSESLPAAAFPSAGDLTRFDTSWPHLTLEVHDSTDGRRAGRGGVVHAGSGEGEVAGAGVA
jgi:DNA gyrase subunit B